MGGGQRVVAIDCRRILDRSSFHDVFAEAFGFPEFYGRNMDAWIDCMTNLDSEFSRVRIETGEILVLRLDHASALKSGAPELWNDLVECSAFVNHRRLDSGESAILALSWH